MTDLAVTSHRLCRSKAADQDVTNSTALVDCTDLTFKMKANQKWRFRAVLFTFGNSSPNMKVAVNGPAAPANLRYEAGLPFRDSAGSAVKTAYDDTVSLDVSTPNDKTLIIEGVVENGTNDGTFAVRFAQALSDANPVRIKRGSYLEAELLP